MIVALTEIPVLEPVGPVLLLSIIEDSNIFRDSGDPLPPRCIELEEKAVSLLASPKYSHARLIKLSKSSTDDTLVGVYSWMLSTFFKLNGSVPAILANQRKMKQLITKQTYSASSGKESSISKCSLV